MAKQYIVPSAEGVRASYNMPADARENMLSKLRSEARQQLARIGEKGLEPEPRLLGVTHNGKFHADEVMATAVLQHVYHDHNFQLIRSRDPEVIATADIAYDVGGIYDHQLRRYDHHQNGALKRENGLTYSALGLIWLHYGELFCDGNVRAAERIDQVLVRGIDARDNWELEAAQDIDTPDYGISEIVEQLNPILEQGETYDEQFYKAVGRSAEILMRLKEKVIVELKTEDEVIAARAKSPDSRYAIMDRQIAPPDSLAHIEGLEYIVFPEFTNDTWQVYTIRTPEDPFTSKRPFPAEWAGLTNQDLVSKTGVEGALFCHAKRFLAVAKTREGALQLLAQALQ